MFGFNKILRNEKKKKVTWFSHVLFIMYNRKINIEEEIYTFKNYLILI